MNSRYRAIFSGRALERGCLALAALVTLLLVLSVYERFAADDVLATGENRTRDQAALAERAQAYREAQLEPVKKRNAFAPIPQPAQLVGVLGNQAIFSNNQMLGVGQAIDGATIVAIHGASITVEREGEEQELKLFNGAGLIQPSTGAAPPTAAGGPVSAPAAATAGAPVRVAPGGPPAGAVPTLGPEQIQQFRDMPPEVREQILQTAPPEIVQQLRDALE